MAKRKIIFHVGGPEFHPVDRQAQVVQKWLGNGYQCVQHDGIDAFEHLVDADLLVLMGLHWTGMAPLEYRSMQERHKRAFEEYVDSGRPILAHHGAVASYDDWPRFGELVGVAWIWGKTNHSPIGTHTVRVNPDAHSVIAGVNDFQIVDELYYDLQIARDLSAKTHASAHFAGKDHPMVITGQRVEAGKVVYLANGHDLRAFEAPAMKRLWINSINWLLR